MKNTKIILGSIIAIIAIASSQSSLIKAAGLAGPGFEIFNKASGTISIALLIDGNLTSAHVPSNGKFKLDVNYDKTIRLGIYNKQTAGISTTFITGAITPQPDQLFDLNAPGKTKYITWNPAKSPSLYPQTGPLMGLLSKTESGYPLGKNIQQSQIVLKK